MDVIKTVTDRLVGAGYRIDDGVITRAYPEWSIPSQAFVYIKTDPRFKCTVWHNLWFDFLFGQEYVPSPCHDCYKVVVTHATVEELFKSYEVLKHLGRTSKCGLDGDRHNTEKLYASYFYNKGLEEGRDCYRIVRDLYTPFVPVILKRGCTEFEQACGPSDQWEITDEQMEIESTFHANFKWGIADELQTPLQFAAIREEWIAKAYQWGDKTYLKFTNGEPLYQPLVTYHKEK